MLYSVFGKSLWNYKKVFEVNWKNNSEYNWIKQLRTVTGIALQPLFNNRVQRNNSTLQRQLWYRQPNLRTVA
jgi:hypothetical protein